MNFVNIYLLLKYYGYTYYQIEISRLSRLGILSRGQALKKSEFTYDVKFINSILKKIGCKLEESFYVEKN